MTLIEMLVILVIFTLLIVTGLPMLQNFLARSKMEGAASQIAVSIQRARLEAVKRGTPAVVQVSTAGGEVVSFVDANDDTIFDAGERQLGRVDLPAGVEFRGPGSTPPLDGFGGGSVSFGTTGVASADGGVILADQRENYLKVEIQSTATGRVGILKYDGSKWKEQTEGGVRWEWN